jgi:hypothetical protein
VRATARGGVRRAPLPLGLGLLLASCAVAPPGPAPVASIPPERATELARRWAADWEIFRGLRAAVDLRLRNRRGTERVAAVLLVAPSALRLEVATPFGLPAVVGTATTDGITIYRVLDRRAQTASASPEASARWLGIPLAPPTLIRLLVGIVPVPADPSAVAVVASSAPHLAWIADGIHYQAWPTAEGRPARVRLDAGGADHLTAEFEWASSGALLGVRLEAPERGAELVLRYLSAEQVTNPPEAFRLTLPPDVPVQRLD